MKIYQTIAIAVSLTSCYPQYDSPVYTREQAIRDSIAHENILYNRAAKIGQYTFRATTYSFADSFFFLSYPTGPVPQDTALFRKQVIDSMAVRAFRAMYYDQFPDSWFKYYYAFGFYYPLTDSTDTTIWWWYSLNNRKLFKAP